MKRHTWSQKDIDLLKKNVLLYGWTAGCKTTAEKIGSTYHSCSTMYWKNRYVTTPTQPLKSNVFKEEKRKRHHFTESEEIMIADYLNEAIGRNPNNITVAFAKCATVFGCSKSAIEQRWYGVKVGKTDFSTKPSCRNNIGAVFAVIGQNTTINSKNQPEPTVKRTSWLFSMLMKALKITRK